MAKDVSSDDEGELLYDQDQHVSKAILNGAEPGCYRCINTNPDKKIWVLTEKQKEHVRDAGLSYLSEIDYMRIDHALISGLVERWRPETNTFHLPTGEATITLEDVAYIYGLPIDGEPVTGRTFNNAFVPEICKELLGLAPRPGKDTIGLTIKFKWLEKNFKPSKQRSDICKTRAYLFFLVSGQIFANSSGARGPAWQLELFREFKPYAWGPACLASLYRMLSRATRLLRGEEESEEGGEVEEKKESGKLTLLKTLTGPLQLIQIWAYSRMAIGRCPKPDPSWQDDLQFPLFKTWEKRLKDNKKLTNMKEIRVQINGLKEEGFLWQPYKEMPKKLLQSVPKGDKKLFTSCTVLIHYWVFERHNPNRVTKQFGMKQSVPPPFEVPFKRNERIERCVIDYSQNHPDVFNLWESRHKSVLSGKKDSSKTHSDDYLLWYGLNTIMEVVCGAHGEGRGSPIKETASPQNVVEEKVSKGSEHLKDDATRKHVFHFLEYVERSSLRADRKKIKLGDFTTRLRKKIKSFRDAFATAFEGFGTESASTSQSADDKEVDDDKEGSSALSRKRAVPKRRERQNLSPTARRLQYSEGKRIDIETIHDDEPIHDNEPIRDDDPPAASFASPVVPHLDDVLTTPAGASPSLQIVMHTPKSDINTLIWRIKRLHRERKIPRYFEDYDHQLVRSAYALTEEELTLLEGFLGFYKEKRDELDIYCTMVSAGSLKKVLDDGTWLDTNIMYWWFEVLKVRYPDVYFYDPSICSWWQSKNSKALQDNCWGKDGMRVWEAKEKRLMVFVLWHEHHFSLLVGFNEERRWEYYNSLKSDRTTVNVAKEFIDFLGNQYANYGWYDTGVWTLLVKTKIPYQDNGNDCGVFALAYAEHLAARIPIAFTSTDIPYYRSKIVVDIYGRSWELNSDRLPIDPLTQ